MAEGYASEARLSVGKKKNELDKLIVFQCRVNPKAIRECPGTKNEYWVIHDPKDIRPYGILYKERN